MLRRGSFIRQQPGAMGLVLTLLVSTSYVACGSDDERTPFSGTGGKTSGDGSAGKGATGGSGGKGGQAGAGAAGEGGTAGEDSGADANDDVTSNGT